MEGESVGYLAREIIANNIESGKQVVAVLIAAGDRVASGVTASVDRSLESDMAARLNGKIRKRLGDANLAAQAFWEEKVAPLSTGVDKALDAVNEGAERAFDSIAKKIDGLENKYAARYVELLARASLPGMKVAHGLSKAVAGGVAKLSVSTAPKTSSKRSGVSRKTKRHNGRRAAKA